MRVARLIIVSAIAAAAVTMPALAKNPESPKTDNESASSTCHAYRQAPDGSWTEEPCQEAGEKPTQHKAAARGGEEQKLTQSPDRRARLR